MKTKLILSGIACVVFLGQANVLACESKENARRLVDVLFVRHIANDFYAGERSPEDRKRLRNDIMNDEENPYRYDQVNQRSFAQLLAWKARRIELELERARN